ncbi:MAG: hypothetical protein HFE85_05550, partial [Clostridiales bacterium]|nr:hypothetical protein [Clostridiales bacterium]
MKKRILSALLSAAMLIGMTSTAVAPVSAQAADTSFETALENRYVDPDRSYQSDLRWWIGEASNTDESILEEIQTLYDGGFHGVELCMQGNNLSPDETYAYGSPMWAHKWKLMMNKFLDLGMEVSLTSGTNWATSNVPGLDPDSQQASQSLAMGKAIVKAGETVTALPKPATMRATNKGQFLGAYAVKFSKEISTDFPNRNGWQTLKGYMVEDAAPIDLSGLTYTEGATVYDQAFEWTVPDDGDYVIFAYWSHGTYKASSPAAETCYATNYFDKRGVETLRGYWEEHYLDDPELNAKILEGDVQLFMDSIELNPDGGITWWSEDIRNEFIARKGYDPMPYLFLVENLPQVKAVYNPYTDPAKGTNDIEGNENFREKFVNDWVDIITQLYCENMLVPLKEWLNSVGIKTRAQISYGRSFEITEPSQYVDYPEAENFNQYDNVDIMRLHVAGGKLQDKVISSETGASLPTYTTTNQMRLEQIYSQYAAGIQRVIWHIWSSSFDYGENVTWPGYGSGFDRWGSREPNSRDYDEFNAHIGRVQQLVQEGKSRTDIGFIHNNWNQGIRFGGGLKDDLYGMNYMLAHQGVYYRSTELQDNGYTYDYLSPDLLKADGVYFDEATKTIESAGYKAVILYQNWLDPDGAKQILDWAKKGLKVVIMENAAKRTPFNDGRDEELAATLAELKALDTVRVAEIYDASEDFDYFDYAAEGYDDGVYEALQELGVRPYAEYAEPNHQLLTQSREDEDGNRYLYVYNYCSNDYHQNSHIESVKNEDHGTNIKTEIKVDGIYVPYQIDAWSGDATQLGEYRYENGQTIFSIDLDFDNIALYAFEKVDDEKFHIMDTNAQSAYADGDNAVIRATESGKYYAITNNGSLNEYNLEVPAAYDITGWDLTVQSWNKGDNKIISEETIDGVHTINTKYETTKTDINVKLDKLTTWNNIPEVGKDVSGTGRYEATFNWDASKADGAYIDFGKDFVSSMKLWINGQKVGGDVSQNPTKTPQAIANGVETGKELYSGGISWVKPVADISEYLQDGENTIVIEYSSTLGNLQLARGAVRVSESNHSWWNNKGINRNYGPAQAVIVPFVEETVAAPEAEPVKSVEAPASAQVNADFDVTVVTAASVTDVRLFNENDMAIGRKAVNVIDNEDGTKTWTIKVAIGTVGARTLKVVTKGNESYLVNSGKTVSIDITSVPPVLNSFDLPDSAVANRTFIVKATTDMAATKIAVYNEYGTKMGVKSLSYKIVDGQKEWTAVMAIGTKGDRTFTAYAVNK